ncbi:MAG: preprotein translocase subunit YajC [Actinobacteria bacterium]|nr:preprotein translocase subunit YajC [Actinomycetota bacterium]
MKQAIPLILIAIAFVVLIVLPMRSRNRELQRVQEMQRSLQVGARVMTSSGMYGRIVGLGEDTVDLEIAPRVTTTWSRMAVREAPDSPGTAGPDRPAGAGADDTAGGEPAAEPT